jgi:hypothetical protein
VSFSLLLTTSGMNHASTDTNNDGVVNSEYGDSSDVMGNGNMVRFNVPHRVEMGWFPSANLKDQLVGTGLSLTSASTIDATGTAATVVGGIRVTKATVVDQFYVSLRTA